MGVEFKLAIHLFVFFEITQVPFTFQFESEWLNCNSGTKQSPNYYSSDLDKVGQMAIRLTFQK